MTIDEILATKIPEGKYELAMIELRTKISWCIGNSSHYMDGGRSISEKEISLCASFEALYDLAMSETAIGVQEIAEYKQRRFEAKVKRYLANGEYVKLDDVLRVVDGMSDDYHEENELDIILDALKRLEALAKGEKTITRCIDCDNFFYDSWGSARGEVSCNKMDGIDIEKYVEKNTIPPNCPLLKERSHGEV